MKTRTSDIAVSAMCAVFLTLSALITIPGTIPFTMQTFAVALISAVFGAKRAAFGIFTYIMLGLLGLPVFSGFRGGAAVIFGASGGYTVGFVFFSLITGFLCKLDGNGLVSIFLSMLAGLAVCYIFGTLWYALLYADGVSDFGAVCTVCVLPFVIPDTVKLCLAAIFARKLRNIGGLTFFR